MIPITTLILVMLVAHWVGDFLLQSNWMATNKSKNWQALGAHALTYTVSIFVFACIASPLFEYTILVAGAWAILNGAIHFSVDAITSRITAKLWEKQDIHNFFVMIGFDQVIHYACLVLTAIPLLLSVSI